jgi:hypothetical protein
MEFLRCCAAATAVLATGLALANRIDIVSEAQASKLWVPDPAQRQYAAGYPDAAADKSRDVCVSIGFLIRPDGSTANFTEMKSWDAAAADGALGQAEAAPYVQVAAQVVSLWRFVPIGKPHSIYTSASFAFDGSNPLGEAAIREHCRIDDLPGFVARAKSRADSRGDLNRAREERARAQRESTDPMGTNLY